MAAPSGLWQVPTRRIYLFPPEWYRKIFDHPPGADFYGKQFLEECRMSSSETHSIFKVTLSRQSITLFIEATSFFIVFWRLWLAFSPRLRWFSTCWTTSPKLWPLFKYDGSEVAYFYFGSKSQYRLHRELSGLLKARRILNIHVIER